MMPKKQDGKEILFYLFRNTACIFFFSVGRLWITQRWGLSALETLP